MIAFVTSLRHPQNSADYGRVESLLEDSLQSVCSQEDEDYIVIVVGNERPTFNLPPRVRFIEVDFPAPAPPSGPQTDLKSFVWDKGTKIGLGLIAAREHDPDYVMIFDADDYVSRRLVGYTRANAGAPGWFVDEGWMYSYSAGVYRPITDFHRTCGTCHIVAFSAYAVPSTLTLDATQQQIAEAFGERLYRILGAHRNARSWLSKNGWDLSPLPFRGAVYNVDTGENHSGKALTGLARPTGAGFEREFGVTPSGTRISRYIAARGPGALFHSAVRFIRRLRHSEAAR